MERRDASTFYLPAGRASLTTLEEEIAKVADSPLVQTLLLVHGGSLVVVNAQRQLVASNTHCLELLGVENPCAVLGLRPGEAAGCVHSTEGPDGCGTGRACPSCGAAIAMLMAGKRDRPVERECYMAIRRGESRVDLDFRVQAAPLVVEGEKLLLLALEEVGLQKRRVALERAFLHDLSNLAASLRSAAEAFEDERDPASLTDLRALTGQLVNEVWIQRALLYEERRSAPRLASRVALDEALVALRATVTRHPAAVGKRLALSVCEPLPVIETEPTLLNHVLTNMLINALEASRPGGEVRLEIAREGGDVAFRVWNSGVIPIAVAPRIFQRYFTTKSGIGRGNGTYAIRLFGEEYLGGRVRFESSQEAGTCFELRLPAR